MKWRSVPLSEVAANGFDLRAETYLGRPRRQIQHELDMAERAEKNAKARQKRLRAELRAEKRLSQLGEHGGS